FARAALPLPAAPLAPLALALGPLGLPPGLPLLAVGCGWGAPLLRAVAPSAVPVVGLPLRPPPAPPVPPLVAPSA
ncbi:class I SAM-dependent methyltransferase, partial [Mycobacterium tuberculosis]|uniref:class I SAM-dependent methyltransferase n=1 Tax=Mycobacterium tuberculosis TaxID=1773 RepID=UPI0015F25430